MGDCIDSADSLFSMSPTSNKMFPDCDLHSPSVFKCDRRFTSMNQNGYSQELAKVVVPIGLTISKGNRPPLLFL